MEQGSQEWKLARCGSLGASRVADAIAKTKTGWGASRANLAAELICERLTGQPTEGFTNAAMQWGTEKEPYARDAYALRVGLEIRQVALVRHPSIALTHASPDGLVGLDGLLEIKCPQTATHIETLTTGAIPQKYITQMQWQMACTGRDWCDFVSFDPRLPQTMALFVKRVERDDSFILQLEDDVAGFLEEVDATVVRLRAMYETAEAA
jgi:putative phage-type endonuclease